MTVYVITAGDYDYCNLVGVTDNEEMAKEFVKLCQDTKCIPDINGFIADFSLEDMPIYLQLLKEGYRQYHVKLYSNGESIISMSKIRLQPSRFKHFTSYEQGLVWAKDEVDAVELVKQYSTLHIVEEK